eukprot:408379_1
MYNLTNKINLRSHGNIRLHKVLNHMNTNYNNYNKNTIVMNPTANTNIDKIKKYELFKVPPRWLFLRIETQNGIIGWGEPNLEGYTDTISAAVKELMNLIINEDPTKINYIWQKFYRSKFYTSGNAVIMSAISGIDQALWDITGKILNVSIHKLLGGAVRNKLKVYCWCGGDGDNTPQNAAESAVNVLKHTNYKMLKMNACGPMEYIDTEKAVEKAIKRMKYVRNAIGNNIEIGLDFHGRVKIPMAKKMMVKLQKYNPLFYEEVVHPTQNNALKDIVNSTYIPIATGERMYNMEQFRDLFEKRCVNIIQPDVSHCGGITNLLNIARLAECYEVSLAPHCPLGPIAFASCLQVDSVCVNFVFQESSMGIHYNVDGKADLLDYIKNKDVFSVDENGFVKLLDGPGLGIEIDEEKVRNSCNIKHNWCEPQWVLNDGCPTTW